MLKLLCIWLLAGGITAALVVGSRSLVLSAVLIGVTLLATSVLVAINAASGIAIGELTAVGVFMVSCIMCVIQLAAMLSSFALGDIVLTMAGLAVQLYLLQSVLFYFRANRNPRLGTLSQI